MSTEELFALEDELVNWAAGVALAELEGELEKYAGIVGRAGWLALGDFQILARLAVNEHGVATQLDLIGLERR